MIKDAENNQLYEGTYTCEASNSVGTKFSTARLTVHGELSANFPIFFWYVINNINNNRFISKFADSTELFWNIMNMI